VFESQPRGQGTDGAKRVSTEPIELRLDRAGGEGADGADPFALESTQLDLERRSKFSGARKPEPAFEKGLPRADLSFELDGKTDGPANMMAAFGQGILTRAEYLNFKRVGYFLGSKAETLNTFFGSMGTDLYEENSTLSTKRIQELINRAKGADRTKLMALQRFAAHFGDFEIKPDGSIVMSRATSKNPMTSSFLSSWYFAKNMHPLRWLPSNFGGAHQNRSFLLGPSCAKPSSPRSPGAPARTRRC
jgi:hypothetical protein